MSFFVIPVNKKDQDNGQTNKEEQAYGQYHQKGGIDSFGQI
jgi:hypothetical protein